MGHFSAQKADHPYGPRHSTTAIAVGHEPFHATWEVCAGIMMITGWAGASGASRIDLHGGDLFMSLESLFFDSSKRTIEQVVQMVQEHPHLFDEIVALALEEKPQVSNRATRVICETSQKNPEMIRSWLPVLIEKLQNVKIDGVKMNILRIFTFQPYPLDDEQLGKLIALCFRFISTVKEKSAVKVYSLEILFRASTAGTRIDS